MYELENIPLLHRRTDINGVELHWVEAGEGPLVVLLHGFPEFWYSWRNQIPALVRAGHRVIAPDLRGYNESSKPAGIDAYRMQTVVQDVAALIARSGDVPCDVVGHDWGGVAAWFLAMMHPDQVRRLVILNSPHPVPFRRELRRSSSQRVRMWYQLFFNIPVLPEIVLSLGGLRMLMRRAGRFTDAELREYAKAWRWPGAVRAMLGYYRAILRHRKELAPLVRPIDVPTLLIWGERDPVFIRATTENFSDYVPDLRVERISEAGHFVQTDAAEKVNGLLTGFLGLSS
ncbi:MAG TPA: alpha/beta hydrolase [Thermoanaerobaculia bacterium]|nr:alpha/beta hydrolase [Thermoanaerobaculia bacterium]